MINKDRIVPITATDLLTMYELIIKAMFMSANKQVVPVSIDAGPIGGFVVTAESTGADKIAFCDEPVKTLQIDAVANGMVVFVPSYDIESITYDETTVEFTEEPDPSALYVLTINNGSTSLARITA